MRGGESRWSGKREGRKGKQREGNSRKMTEQQRDSRSRKL